MDISKDVTINKFALDDEAKALPSLIAKYHTYVNDESKELVDLQYELEKEEAVARKNIRAHFTACGTKATLEMVNDELALNDAVSSLRKTVEKKKVNISYLRGVLSALEAKRSSLNNLVSLYVKDFYSNKAVDNGNYAEADAKHKFSKDFELMSDRQESSLVNAMRRR